MKLHLGCGQIYLDGYINIDYPLDKHSVQKKSVADKLADITALKYKSETVDEVRLHHLFEHFPRTQAVALFASWHSWLKKGGLVHIEVPDFFATADLALNPSTSDTDRNIAIRHIFGSNEADWAVHYDAWGEDRFRELCKTFGFKLIEVKRNEYLATRNIEIIAKKNKSTPPKDKIQKIAEKYLKQFTLNDSDFETKLLGIWMKHFNTQLKKGFSDQ